MIEEQTEEVSKSEFGSGIVVCLAKFSEHLWNWSAESVMNAHWWLGLSQKEREDAQKEVKQFPHGDMAQRVMRLHCVFMGIRQSEAHEFSAAVEMWANGASDHFYDLAENAPAPLKELAELTLMMGHGFSDRIWTWEDWLHMRELWKQSCLAVDAMLGIDADWGNY